MKRTFLLLSLIIGVISAAAFFAAARGDTNDAKPADQPEAKGEAKADAKSDAKAEAKPDEKKDAAPRLSRDTNGNVVLTLDDETQKHAALKLDAIAATQLAPELKGYGRVLDPAPLAALVTEAASAQAAASASSNELARLKMLATSGNASERALQTADAAALHDQLVLQSAHDRLALSWGREIANRADLPAFLQSLNNLESVLVRIDLPAGQRLSSPPTGARVVPLNGSSIDAQLVGAALGVDPLTQGQGYILQITPNPTRLLPGEAVIGYLKIAGDPLAGVVVPREAVVRTEGKGWVYVAGSDDHFTRKEIALDHATENGWFVTNGIAAGEQVVVSGAAALLSEESKSQLTPD